MKVSTYSTKALDYEEINIPLPLGIRVQLEDGTSFNISESKSIPNCLSIALNDGSVIEVQPGSANVVYIHRSTLV